MYKVINTSTGKTLDTFKMEWVARAYAADVGKRIPCYVLFDTTPATC